MKEILTSISKIQSSAYPSRPPYHPKCIYPEFKNILPCDAVDASNSVYDAVRNSFKLLKYDSEHVDSASWNPMSWLIEPGQTVFIKPNMISQKHWLNNDWDYVITHGSVIRAVVDYVFLALKGKGCIIIGDGPQSDSKFDEIVALMGLKEIQSLYSKFDDFQIEIINLQDEHWIEKNGIYVEKVKLTGDPAGSVHVDLAQDSMFTELDGQGKRYYGAFYNIDETNEHHRDGKHEYPIAKTPIIADVFVNVPKLKTHKKCGITLNLKSLVGINANKNWLPHYIFGFPENGGDQFERQSAKANLENSLVIWVKEKLVRNNCFVKFLAQRLKKVAYRIFGDTEEVVRSGNWHGNDTVWRMSMDLNRILMYANEDGTMREKGDCKRFLSIIDGIVAMEGNGPVAGTRKETGIIITGDNPVSVDAVGAKVMGFDYKKLPLIARAFELHRYPLINVTHENIRVFSNEFRWDRMLCDVSYEDSFKFKPHFGWINKIEETA